MRTRRSVFRHPRRYLLPFALILALCVSAFGGATVGPLFVLLFFSAFACEVVDSSFGMGYGTLLVPVLLLLGFPPRDAVPAILVSELATGLAASVGHHLAGNVDFTVRSRSWNTAVVLGSVAVFTSPVAALLVAKLPSDTLTTAIGYLILAEGIAIAALHHSAVTFSWFRIVVLGAFASFLKSLCGGGYGPLVTGGQLLIGVEGRHAVAITSFAETITCFVALVAFAWGGGHLNVTLLWPILLGAMSSIPLSVAIVHNLKTNVLRSAVGAITATIGLLIVLLPSA